MPPGGTAMSNNAAEITAWFALRSVLDEIVNTTDYKSLDSLTQRLFEWIYLRCKEDRPLHTQEILYDSKVASHATIQKNIPLLEKVGLINISSDLKDSRRKIITVTPKAHQLVATLSQSVQSWVQSH